jgi:hypothetical protein
MRGNTRVSWNMRSTPSRASASGRSPAMERPSRATRPASGTRWPLRMFRSVVLPEPFGPMRPTSSPSFTAKLARSTALRPLKDFTTLSTERHGMRCSYVAGAGAVGAGRGLRPRA